MSISAIFDQDAGRSQNSAAVNPAFLAYREGFDAGYAAARLDDGAGTRTVPREDLEEVVAFVRELRPLLEQFHGLAAKVAAGGPAALFGLVAGRP